MLLHPWDFAGKSTRVGCDFLLQRIFPTRGSNPGLPHCKQTLYRLSHQKSLDSILKSRDITLLTNIHIVKAMVFPVIMYGCKHWTIKKTESWRIDAFELWCWRRLLQVPWTAERANQSILKDINPKYSLEGLRLKLETPILWPPDTKSQLIRKDPDAGKYWSRRKRGWQRIRWLDGITD